MAVSTLDVQKLYVAYFNRPADVAGLDYWTKISGATTADIAKSFSEVQEYKDTFANKTYTEVVNEVYNNLFGRDPEFAGLTFWANLLGANKITVSDVVTAVYAGAQGDDKTILENKVAAAAAFTTAIDTAVEAVAYTGETANATARAYLSAVTADAASVTAAAASANTVLAKMIADAAPAGQTFTLTTGIDAFTATQGSNTFIAPALGANGATITTLNSTDVIQGTTGDTTDTFILTATPTANTTLVGSVKNIEKIVINGSDNVDTTATAAQKLAVTAAQAVVTAAELAATAAKADDTAATAAAAASTAADDNATAAADFLDKVINGDGGSVAAATTVAEFATNATTLLATLYTAADRAVAAAITTAASQLDPTSADLTAVTLAGSVVVAAYVDAADAADATATDADTTAGLTDAVTLAADLVTAKATLADAVAEAGQAKINAAFFVGSNDITVDGVNTVVTGLTTQNVNFSGEAVNNGATYSATTIAGNVTLNQANGTVTLNGAKLATATVAGSVLAADASTAGTVTIVDGSDTIKTLHLKLTSDATVDVSDTSLLTSIDATGANALTLKLGNTLGLTDSITGGTGVDTVVATLDEISTSTYKPTIAGVEKLSLTFTNDATFDASKVTGATTFNVSGNTSDATIKNLSTSVTSLVSNVDNGEGSIDVGYAAGTAGKLAYTIGGKADVNTNEVHLTNVGELAVNAVGTHDSYIYWVNGGKTLTSMSFNTAAGVGDLRVDYADAFALTTDSNAEVSSLQTLSLNAAAGTSITMGEIYAGGDPTYNSSGARHNGVAASNPATAISLTTGEEATIGFGGSSLAYEGGSISSLTVAAGIDSSIVLSEYIYVEGVRDTTNSGSTDYYLSGGNVGSVNITAATGSTVDTYYTYAEGSIGNTVVNLAANATVAGGFVAGYENVLIDTFGNIGDITVTAATNAGQTDFSFETSDTGLNDSSTTIGNVTVSAGDYADDQSMVTYNRTGDTGNVSAVFGKSGVGTNGNDTEIRSYGSIGNGNLVVGADTTSKFILESDGSTVGTTTIKADANSTVTANIYGSVSTGAITATAATGSDLTFNLGGGAVGNVTVSGAGAVTVLVDDSSGIFADSNLYSLADSIGTVDLSGVKGAVEVDLDSVDAGTTIKLGSGVTSVNGTAGADTITLLATHTAANTIIVNSASIGAVDAVSNFKSAKDTLTFAQDDLFAPADAPTGWTVSASGAATKLNAQPSDFVTAFSTDTHAGIVSFVSTSGSVATTWVLNSDGLGSPALDQLIKVSGVNAGALALASATLDASSTTLINASGFNVANDKLKIGSTTVFADTVVGDWTVVDGVATYTGSTPADNTAANFVAAFTTDSANTGVALYSDSANTWVVNSDGLASDSLDSVVELVGLTGVAALDSTVQSAVTHLVLVS